MNLKSNNLKKSFLSKFVFIFSVFVVVGLFYTVPGCGGGDISIGVSAKSDLFSIAPEQVNPRMDIIWVVDSSVSMRRYVSNVQKNAMAFVQTFIDKGFDFNLGVISTAAWSHYAYKENNTDFHAVMYNTLNSGQVWGLDTGSPVLTEEHITALDTAATSDNALFLALQFPDGYDINLDGDFDDDFTTELGVSEYPPPTFPIVVNGVTYTSATESDVPGSPSFYDSFIYKFRVNFDVYGFRSKGVDKGQTGGFMAYGRGAGSTGVNLNGFIADEKGLHSLRAFFEFGDEAKSILEDPVKAAAIDASRSANHPDAPANIFANRNISGFSDFLRGPEEDLPPAFLAVIMISDENDGSRYDRELAGTTPVDNDGDGLVDYDQIELVFGNNRNGMGGNGRNYLTGSGENYLPIAGQEDLWPQREGLVSVLDYVKRQGLEDESLASYFYDVYTISKKSGLQTAFWADYAEFQDGEEGEENKWFDITDTDFSEELSQISTNIVQAATVYPLNCEPDVSTISVTFKKEGQADIIVPLHDPNHPTDPELNGYEYVDGGDQYFLRFYADSIPEAGMTMNVLYDPLSLGCET